VIYDELIGEPVPEQEGVNAFSDVESIEGMDPEKKWRFSLSWSPGVCGAMRAGTRALCAIARPVLWMNRGRSGGEEQ